jgi:aerobic-type carbon monoxide dehydrogenase small subunit (CoxS/CutS family)
MCRNAVIVNPLHDGTTGSNAKTTPNPTDDDIDNHQNICRCGTYYRMGSAHSPSSELTNEAF